LQEKYKKLLYMSIEQKLKQEYQALVALCNSIQDLMSEGHEEVVLKNNQTLQNTFSEYVNSACNIQYLEGQNLSMGINYVNAEVNNFFNTQEIISVEDFQEHKELNEEFTEVFWEDLEVFKNLEVVQHMLNDVVYSWHENHMKEFLSQKYNYFNQLTRGDEDWNKLFRIAKRDETLFTFVLVYLTPEDKKTILDFYYDNGYEDRDREEYVDYLLDYIGQ